MHGMIMVVEDETTQRDALAQVLTQWGHEVTTAHDARQALGRLGDRPFDLVMTDLRMPGGSGQDLLEDIRRRRPDVDVVVMTAFGTVDAAVDAMKTGAADFVSKPLDLERLELVIRRVLERRQLMHENRALRQRLAENAGGSRLLGSSPGLQEVLARAGLAAETDATVLIHGESGTGKELLARTVHDLSPRAAGPFVAVNCAALPETLLESELFGHLRGAFTGAERDRRGRVLQASGGTLFLDEIGDVAGPVQGKLLRFLQEREITPVGGDTPVSADVRVVAATHRDLVARTRDGSFREDLYFRLNVVGLHLPPLRERREDIPELVTRFLTDYAHRYARPARAFSAEAMAVLMGWSYAGNIRELKNIVEQAVVMTRGEVIHRSDLPHHLQAGVEQAAAVPPPAPQGSLASTLGALEQSIVLATLEECAGNQSEAARRLGLTESGLRYKLAKWRGAD
jgi:DNA-binding NtrC family response regulator